MQFTLILALASVFTSVISAPAAAPETDLSIEKRQTDATSIITTLNAAIAGPVASIRKPCSLSPFPGHADLSSRVHPINNQRLL